MGYFKISPYKRYLVYFNFYFSCQRCRYIGWRLQLWQEKIEIEIENTSYIGRNFTRDLHFKYPQTMRNVGLYRILIWPDIQPIVLYWVKRFWKKVSLCEVRIFWKTKLCKVKRKPVCNLSWRIYLNTKMEKHRSIMETDEENTPYSRFVNKKETFLSWKVRGAS